MEGEQKPKPSAPFVAGTTSSSGNVPTGRLEATELLGNPLGREDGGDGGSMNGKPSVVSFQCRRRLRAKAPHSRRSQSKPRQFRALNGRIRMRMSGWSEWTLRRYFDLLLLSGFHLLSCINHIEMIIPSLNFYLLEVP